MPRELFELTIDENTETGVSFVALVDVPAIMRKWVAFNADGQQQRKVYTYFSDDEKRIVAGPLMIPDLPIYRKDENGEYDVFFSKATIEKCVMKFMRQGNGSNFNLMHNPNATTEGVFIFQTYLIDSKAGMNAPSYYRGETLPDGTWFAMAKVEDEAVWQKVKDGTFQGFSVEGIFEHQQKEDISWLEGVLNRLQPEPDYSYLENLINSIK